MKCLKLILLLSCIAVFGLEAKNPDAVVVALAGSSACDTFGSRDTNLIFGWGEVLNNYFKPEVRILNHAKSGRSTKSFISEGRWDKLLADKPDYILMTLGANDTKGKKYSTDVNTEYKDNLRKFAADADKIGAKIIFVTLNQSLRWDKKNNKAVFFHGKALRSDRIAYSQAIRDVAKELNRPCLELFENQRILLEKMGEEKAGKLYRYTPKGQIDPSHTNFAGAKFIAQIIVSELKKSSSDLKKYLE